mgnify:CR=1 FL=1
MAKQQKTRLVLDTNWYISAIISRKSRRILYELLIDERLVILYTDRLQSEFLEVIYRPKFKNVLKPGQILRFLSLTLSRLEYVAIKTSVVLSRDPKDNYLLSLSQDGNAQYLVTGDLDLLVIGKHIETHIITMAEFRLVLAELK